MTDTHYNRRKFNKYQQKLSSSQDIGHLGKKAINDAMDAYRKSEQIIESMNGIPLDNRQDMVLIGAKNMFRATFDTSLPSYVRNKCLRMGIKYITLYHNKEDL